MHKLYEYLIQAMNSYSKAKHYDITKLMLIALE